MSEGKWLRTHPGKTTVLGVMPMNSAHQGQAYQLTYPFHEGKNRDREMLSNSVLELVHRTKEEWGGGSAGKVLV